MEETIEGYVDHIIYRNQDNGYTVACLIVDGEELTCVGIFQYLNEGENIRAKGKYTEHPSMDSSFLCMLMKRWFPRIPRPWNDISAQEP